MRKKSQVLYQDFIVAIVIFTVAILFYYKYAPTFQADEGAIDELLVNANIISNSLISAGYPLNWTNDVERIGITDGKNRINETKLLQFANMSYKDAKFLFGSLYDYLVFFEDKNSSLLVINNITGIGKENINSTNIFDVEKPKKLVKTRRLVIYDSDIYNMVVYVWEK